MSTDRFATPAREAIIATVMRLWLDLGLRIRDARLARQWTVPTLAGRAGVSTSLVYLVERGEPASSEAAVRLASALGLRLEFALVDPRRRGQSPTRSIDPVHAAMGELEAARLRGLGYHIGVDEPYQHFQFAGRADIVAWHVQKRALLHLENRTRFPDLQDMAGSYNAKRAYLAPSIADRVGVRRWSSETHVMVALWSAEVLHALRLRRETFRALCPDPDDAFGAWWRGSPPEGGMTSTLVVLDPVATIRQRSVISFGEALLARPRHRGYAETAARLEAVSSRTADQAVR